MTVHKPKIIIVNENDELINHKFREDVERSDIYRVSALWITNSRGEILLAQRSFNKAHNPGQWGPAVAGTNDEGETYESNIIKEAEEEIGLRDFDLRMAGKLRRTGNIEGYNFFCQWFVAIIDKDISEFDIQDDEVEQIKWFRKEDLQKEAEKKSKNFFSSMQYCLKNL